MSAKARAAQAMVDGGLQHAIARSNGAPLAFAGLWEGWRSPDGEMWCRFAILSTRAHGSMRQLHERMPVILEAIDWPSG